LSHQRDLLKLLIKERPMSQRSKKIKLSDYLAKNRKMSEETKIKDW
jgi:hypothetical protein